MMTFEEYQLRRKFVNKLYSAVVDAYFTTLKKVHKLDAYNILLEPPATIRKANEARIERLRKKGDELWRLRGILEHEEDKLRAMPTVSTYTVLGETRKLIHKGMLPNFEETSTDEAEAMRMLADFYAKEKTA